MTGPAVGSLMRSAWLSRRQPPRRRPPPAPAQSDNGLSVAYVPGMITIAMVGWVMENWAFDWLECVTIERWGMKGAAGCPPRSRITPTASFARA
jgi:hypothetical protein